LFLSFSPFLQLRLRMENGWHGSGMMLAKQPASCVAEATDPGIEHHRCGRLGKAEGAC
jgi:hypothetical protein